MRAIIELSLAFVALSAVYKTEYTFILLVYSKHPELRTMQSVGGSFGEYARVIRTFEPLPTTHSTHSPWKPRGDNVAIV